MVKAVQQFMLGTVMNTEEQAADTMANMKAAGYDGIELCGFMIHPTGFLVRMMTRAAGMPVLDAGRERQVIDSRTALAATPAERYAVAELFESILTLSRRQQRKIVKEGAEDPGYARWLRQLASQREPVQNPRVVYQGEPGCYSEEAAVGFFGEEIEAIVMLVSDRDCVVKLSKKRLDANKNWEIVENAVENKDVLEGIITEENKGGLVANVKGVRVFIPASQSGKPRGADLSEMVKTRVQLRITEVNRARRRVVGSIRAVASEARAAAAAAIPVKDTIKVAGADGVVQSTPDRETLRAVQTPQAFDSQLLRAALQSAKDASVSLTDDCAAVERLGMKVVLTPGDERNIKLTTPADLVVGELLSEEAPAL